MNTVLYNNGGLITIHDSVLGKRVLTYWQNRGNINYHHKKVVVVAMDNIDIQTLGQVCTKNHEFYIIFKSAGMIIR